MSCNIMCKVVKCSKKKKRFRRKRRYIPIYYRHLLLIKRPRVPVNTSVPHYNIHIYIYISILYTADIQAGHRIFRFFRLTLLENGKTCRVAHPVYRHCLIFSPQTNNNNL